MRQGLPCLFFYLEAFMKFKLYKQKPNDIKFGKLYVTSLDVPFDDTKRTIRVYVPKGYDENDKSKRYKVLYMSDGQNIVDKYTSAYGAWDLDVVVNDLTKEGYEPPIIVGIDSPKSDIKRTNELCSPVPTNKKGINISSPIGNQFVDFVFDVVGIGGIGIRTAVNFQVAVSCLTFRFHEFILLCFCN